MWVGQVELTDATEIIPVLRPATASDVAAKDIGPGYGVPLADRQIVSHDGVPDAEEFGNEARRGVRLAGCDT